MKYHYNREERLKMGGRSNKDDDNCFFCAKNRYIQIMLVNLILLLLMSYFYYNYVGRTKKVMLNGMEYLFSKRKSSREGVADFTLHIKNHADGPNSLENPILYFEVRNEKEEAVFTKELLISKLTYKKDEFHKELIIVEDLTSGKYSAYLKVDEENELKLGFSIK